MKQVHKLIDIFSQVQDPRSHLNQRSKCNTFSLGYRK